MKKNIFIVNTYFQLITAGNLSLNFFKNEINDVILTDMSIGMENKIENLRKTNVFNKIYYIRCKDILNSTGIKKYNYYFFDRYFNRKRILKTSFEKYDELLFFNVDMLTGCVLDELLKKNKKLVCSKYDEGFDTYTNSLIQDCKKYKVSNIINKILCLICGKKNTTSMISKLYLYHPELLCYETDWKIEKIPDLDKNNIDLKNTLNLVFNYKPQTIKQKYIFFEESFFCDNKGINDFPLINDIVNVVGKNNIIVKLHPRNSINRFEKLGVEVLKDIGVPWEIIQMNEDYTDKVFVTISSGSILASKLYFNEDIKTFLLYNCTEKKSDVLSPNFYKYLKKIDKTIGLGKIIIPNSKDELLNMLKEEQ